MRWIADENARPVWLTGRESQDTVTARWGRLYVARGCIWLVRSEVRTGPPQNLGIPNFYLR